MKNDGPSYAKLAPQAAILVLDYERYMTYDTFLLGFVWHRDIWTPGYFRPEFQNDLDQNVPKLKLSGTEMSWDRNVLGSKCTAFAMSLERNVQWPQIFRDRNDTGLNDCEWKCPGADMSRNAQ